MNRLMRSQTFSFFLFVVLVAPIMAQPIPTNEWVNFLSTNSTFNDELIEPGSVVDAYDPDGIHCGTFTVTSEGQYGFLLVYRDDATTESVDEGAEPGDLISFWIDGFYATESGPGEPSWSSNGAVVELNLNGYSNYPPVISGFPLSLSFRADSSISLQLNTYVDDINDPDSDLTWTVLGNISVNVEIISGTNEAILTSSLEFSGTEEIVFYVSDNSAANDSVLVEVIVTPYVSIDNYTFHPYQFELNQNYPNPFNPTTTIGYGLPEGSNVYAAIYDIRGSEIIGLVDQYQEAGYYTISWNGLDHMSRRVDTGIYMMHFQVGELRRTIKMAYLE